MSAGTTIEWTDNTFNPWWGCSRVSPACRFCYADTAATRWGHELWKRNGPRRMLSEAVWRNPPRWNRDAQQAGRPAKVFCASMADVFEVHPVAAVNAQMDAARTRLWSLIEQTPWLIWQLLTKRPENVAALAPWGHTWPENVWLGTSVEDHRRATSRIGVLAATGARTRFLSCEPLLEDLDLTTWLTGPESIDWVIVGGESGPRARPMDPAWARSLREQCVAARVPFFFKQWGEWAPTGQLTIGNPDDPREQLVGPVDDDGRRAQIRRLGRKQAGRVLDGRTWDEFPDPVTARPPLTDGLLRGRGPRP